jgi:V/A-type H+-transporting ATPase subunit E
MGLEAIVEEIKAKGKAEANKISKEAKKEASQIIADAQSRAEKITGAKKEAVAAEIGRLKQQELSSANLEVKRELLNARKEILDLVHEKSVEGVKNFPAENNKELLKAIIEKNEAGNSKIYSISADKAAVKKLTKLKYAGEIDCLGGIVMENEDGTIYLDFKYDTILKETSEKSLKQVSDILFG